MSCDSLTSFARPRALRAVAALFAALALGAVEGTFALDPEAGAGRVADLTPARRNHLALLGVDRWHTHGMRGRGVKVAILDSGFRGYRDYCGNVLPAQITTRSFRKDGNLEAKDSQHGILCGEVVHALAPDAELLFANWEPDDGQAFLEAVRWARAAGARVISCSVIMPSQSDGEGGGRAHEQLAQALDDDVLMFACGGNTAQRQWTGSYRPHANGFHEWRAGIVDNGLSPWGRERVAVDLCCKPDAHYELQIVDRARGDIVARSQNALGGSCAVHFQPQSGRDYSVRVRLLDGKPLPFQVVALEAGLQEATLPGSVVFPADGPEVIAVGAVDGDGKRAAYSACGSEQCKSKPDLVAPVPFTSSWRARPFSGTSAAAPQAAALAALVWSRNLASPAERIRATLRKSARDLGSAGPDQETGCGMIQLPALTPASRSN